VGDVVITVGEDGPYRVEGDFELLDQDGRPIEAPGSTLLLCRC
jgi:hypothetical protein